MKWTILYGYLKLWRILWLIFEYVKPKTLEINDHMERIMKLKQVESTNRDFSKQVQTGLEVYEKHGGDFLWGDSQDTELAERV